MRGSVGVSTTLEYRFKLKTNTKNCNNCKFCKNNGKYVSSFYCKGFGIRVTDVSNAKLCSKFIRK